jgi:uncharacterized protein
LKRFLIILLVFVLAVTLAGCGGGNGGNGGNGGDKPKEKPWPAQISIATGGTGGVYYPYGGGMAKIIDDKVAGMTASATVTGASVENIRLVHSGDAEIALIMGDAGYEAWAGQGGFAGDKQDILVAFQMYPNIYHVVTLEEYDIKSISDLKGKRVSVGAPGSGTEYKTGLVLGALGITYSDFRATERLSFAAQTDQMKDKNLDVAIWSVGPPTSTILDLGTTHKIRILAFTDEEIKKVMAAHPFYVGTTLEANTYQGIPAVQTLAVWNSAIVHKDAPVDKVYAVVKAIFENQPELLAIHPVAKWTTPQITLENSSIPFHPGAIKYLEEKGFKVPDNLKP